MTTATEANAVDLRELRLHLRPGDRRSRRRHPARNRVRGHPERLVLPGMRGPDLRLPPAGARRGLSRLARGARLDCSHDFDWLVCGLRFRGLGLRAEACREGLLGRGARVRQSLSRRGLRRVDPEAPAPLLLGAAAGHARRPAHDLLQGRLRRLRQRRRRRQPRLRQHALPRPPRLLRGPAVERARRLGARAGPPLRRRAERMLGVVEYEGMGAGRQAAAGIRRGDRRRRDLHQHPGRRLLRQARRRGPRPLLRRRGPGPHRLHALRQLHGRLPPRSEEHAGEELPLVRREARGGGSSPNGR